MLAMVVAAFVVRPIAADSPDEDSITIPRYHLPPELR